MKKLAEIMRFDIITVRHMFGGMLFFGGISVVAGFVIMPIAFCYLLMIVPVALMPLESIAAKNDFNRLYGVLPVSRGNIIMGRFMLIFISGFVPEILSIALMSAAYGAKLYKLIPMTDPASRNAIEESFNFDKSYGAFFKLFFICFAVITFINAFFTMMTKIHGSENAGKIAFASVGGLLVLCFAFIFLNELDLIPLINVKDLLDNTMTVKLAVTAVITNIAVFGICILFGGITVRKTSGREL